MVPEMSVVASWPTVKAPPEEVCLTTWDVPPVALKFVVPAGKVRVFDPAAAAALSVTVPDDEPLSARSPSLKLWTPDHVFVPFKSGMVAPDVPVAVLQPVAPLDRSPQAIVVEPPSDTLWPATVMLLLARSALVTNPVAVNEPVAVRLGMLVPADVELIAAVPPTML